MRFKTDENLHPEVASWLSDHGHPAVTVWDEGLRGKSDSEIAKRLRSERRALITLDAGFGDIRTYPPSDYSGIVVLRLAWHDRKHVLAVMPRVIELLGQESVEGKLWVIDEHSIRVRGDQHGDPAPEKE